MIAQRLQRDLGVAVRIAVADDHGDVATDAFGAQRRGRKRRRHREEVDGSAVASAENRREFGATDVDAVHDDVGKRRRLASLQRSWRARRARRRRRGRRTRPQRRSNCRAGGRIVGNDADHATRRTNAFAALARTRASRSSRRRRRSRRSDPSCTGGELAPARRRHRVPPERRRRPYRRVDAPRGRSRKESLCRAGRCALAGRRQLTISSMCSGVSVSETSDAMRSPTCSLHMPLQLRRRSRRRVPRTCRRCP